MINIHVSKRFLSQFFLSEGNEGRKGRKEIQEKHIPTHFPPRRTLI